MESKTDLTRKEFFSIVIPAVTVGAVAASPVSHMLTNSRKIKAIAFDAFTIFDARPVTELADVLFPGKGKDLSNNWRIAQFEYCWLRTTGDRYKNFADITRDALVSASKKTGIQPTAEQYGQLMQQYLTLPIWPDVLPGLEKLREQKLQLVFLSNMTGTMLQQCSEHNRIENYFKHLISTGQAKTYKPDPKAYQLGVDVCRLKKEEILFVAFAGWDVAGAKWYGYPTYWLNRSGAVAEELDAKPDGVGKTISELYAYLFEG